MLKKIIGLVLVILLFGLVIPVWALEDCSDKSGNEAANCWARRESELQQLISQSQGQQKTLAGTIAFLDNTIALTQAQIYQTEEELKVLEGEIITLSVKIVRLNDNLGEVSKLLISRVGEAYKRASIKPVYLFLTSNGFNDFFIRNKYLKAAQQNDRKILLELQSSKDNHEEQKEQKEKKQKEKEVVQNRLISQKSVHASQKREKQNLLDVTKNDEKRYQSLLTEARAQKAAFRSYVASQGGASILSGQTKCDDWGCYYNQRDSSWGNMSLGSSILSVAEYGCLVSSVSMIASHNKINLKPSDIAAESSAFYSPDIDTALLWNSFTVNGISVSRPGISISQLDSKISAGQPVIAELYVPSGIHFVVIKGKNDQGYIIHDPFAENGHDKQLSDKFSVSNIGRLYTVNFN